MNLHKNKDLLTAVIRDMAQKTTISEVYIEKDYWITRSLQRLSQNPNAEKVVLSELPMLAFSEIPEEKVIEENFIDLMKKSN